MKKIIKITALLMFFFLYQNVNAEELIDCKMSNEYKEWLDAENKDSLLEPDYCEIDSTANNFLKDFTIRKIISTLMSTTETRYNANEEGYVTSSKNQHENNACWAFTATSLIETQSIYYKALTKNQADFSEAHIFYNTSRNSFENITLDTYNRTLLTGGNSMVAASYFFNGKGPVYESAFPYSNEAKFQQKSYVENSFDKPVVSVDEYLYETHYNDNNSCTNYVISLKTKIKEFKSVGTNIFVDDSYMNAINGNYYYKYSGTSNVGNHAVVLVGWDDTIPASNFKNATTNGAWIAKNSWGTSWGNNGYFYISYEDTIVCKDSYNFKINKDYKYDKSYNSSEVFGNMVFSINGPIYITTQFENVGNEILDRISFAVVENSNYTAYLSKNNNINDNSNWIELGSGTSNINGVKSLYFKGIDVNNSFTIILKFEPKNSEQTSFYGMCSSNNEESLVYNMNISKGKNYYFNSVNGSKFDLAEINQTVGTENFMGCEPVIYAYTKNNNNVKVTSTNGSYVIGNDTIFVSLNDKNELNKSLLLSNITINGSYKILNSNNTDVTSTATTIGTGYKISVDGTIYNIIVKGDISGDGKIKSNDALLISRYLVNLTTLDQNKIKAADVSNDGKIKSNDALLISRFLVGLRSTL